MGKDATIEVPRGLLELAYRALDDAGAEIEAFEKQVEWYTPSGRMMERIEGAMLGLKEVLK